MAGVILPSGNFIIGIVPSVLPQVEGDITLLVTFLTPFNDPRDDDINASVSFTTPVLYQAMFRSEAKGSRKFSQIFLDEDDFGLIQGSTNKRLTGLRIRGIGTTTQGPAGKLIEIVSIDRAIISRNGGNVFLCTVKAA